MPEGLVTTKLRPPRIRPGVVERPRLQELVADLRTRPLTLISAPAGFGKSTLLGSWREQLNRDGCDVAWFSVDEADNDPTRFLCYLLGALQQVDAAIGTEAAAALGGPQPPPAEALAEVLVNDLARHGRCIVIMVDDYHLIDSEAIHHSVAFLLERLPENVQVAISARTDPALPLAKLRARNQLAEVRAADLRFTGAETTAFLQRTMGLTVTSAEAAELEGITEGWVAALQLAALSMRGHDTVAQFITAFNGNNRHVLDFMAEEVLNQQPAAVREFLLLTSALDRMSAPLCDALTGGDHGQQMLEELERANLFVVPLDDDRRWYRYHHLFADFLRSRLETEMPGRRNALHRAASAWHERNGSIDDAIDQALTIPDYELAARLLLLGAQPAWSRGEGLTVLRWLTAMPAEVKRRHPWLVLEHSLALTLAGGLEEAEPLLNEAEELADDVADGTEQRFLRGYAAAVRAHIARQRGDAPRSADLARAALDLLPVREFFLRNFATVTLGDALRVIGDLAPAGEAFAEAARIGRAGGSVYGSLMALAHLARLQTVQGELRRCEETLRQAAHVLATHRAELLPAAGPVHIARGALLYERGDLDGAEWELDVGVKRAQLSGGATALVWGYVSLSKVKRARGDWEGAVELVDQATDVAVRSQSELDDAVAANWKVRLALSRGDVAEAETVIRKHAVCVEVPTRDMELATRFVEQLTAARFAHAHGQYGEALRVLGDLQEIAERGGRRGNLLEVLTLQAVALWASDRRQAAVDRMTRAIAIAEPEGFLRTFVDEETSAGVLLEATLDPRLRVRDPGRARAAYLARLQAALARVQETPEPRTQLVEEPSDREMEVLALIAGGASNAEIAAKLFVSTSTVKTHVNNLYRKLEVGSRTQAVARAREIGLL